MAKENSRVMRWLNERLPVTTKYQKHMTRYLVPKNLNFWYFFGVISTLMLVNQLLTGSWLAMHYIPTESEAFASIQHIMRDVEWGWLLRYMHAVGASFLFIAIYLHMMRGLLYGSYRKPRELVWIFGMMLYMLLMVAAFTGYVLPWGQMSYWGAQVITSLFTLLPFGDAIGEWVRGDYLISGATLSRFFIIHVFLVPMMILLLVFLHIWALHSVGSNNPEGIDIKHEEDKIPFHPYFTLKDLVGLVVFLLIFTTVVFFFPEGGGFILEQANYQPVNTLNMPEHVTPIWYFGAFYSILRAIPDALMGLVAMAAAIALLFVLPWLDRSPVRSWRYKGGVSRALILLFAADFVLLTWLGTQPVTEFYLLMARLATAFYFLFFLLMPVYSRLDPTKPLPERIS